MQSTFTRDIIPRHNVDNFFILSICILETLNNLNPIVDTNLLRIYCSEFNKDLLQRHKADDIVPITPQLSQILERYIYDNLFGRLQSMMDNIKWLIGKNPAIVTISIPAVAKTAVDDTLAANNPQGPSVAIDPITRLKSILFENNRSLMETFSQSTPIVDTMNIDQDDIDNFVDIVSRRITALQDICAKDAKVVDIRTKVNSTLDYVKSLLYLLLFNRGVNLNQLELYLPMIFINMSDSKVLDAIYNYSHLSLASALCVYPGMILNIKSNKSKCSLLSDSYRFLRLSMAHNVLMNKMIKDYSQ